MPNLDGTGPSSKGARTGRGRGTCKEVKEETKEEENKE